MKVLITGGFGFVGCNLIAELNKRGHRDLVVIDNETLGSRKNISGLAAEAVVGDIRDAPLVERLVKKADAIIHLAADTRVIESIGEPVYNFEVNVLGSLNILEAMRKAGKKRIVFASTGGAIIGEAEPPLHEGMVPRPISPYGASKLAIEGYLSAYAGSYGMLPISFRFSNVYGPRSFHKGSVVAAFFRAALAGKRLPVYGDGEQTRDFIFAGDLCKVIIDSLESETTGVFQLGSGRPTSINALLAAMSKVVGEDLFARVDYHPARQGEITRTYCDISLARSRLGFDPRMPLEQGLAATWEWFLSRNAASRPEANPVRA
jgi:UDP-glucose 4-epimerase